MKILVVEDDRSLSSAICKIIENEGYFTDAVYDGEEALYYIKEYSYDLIILDIMLPGVDGIEILRRTRNSGIGTPVLMLTAKSTVADKVLGLNSGADDYMAKPFDPNELIARINALTRRRGDMILNEISYGDIRLNLSAATLSCGENTIQLTKKELEMLRLLMLNSSMAITKESFIVNIWGLDSDITENNVEAYISFIKKKLRFLKSSVRIRNLRGIGYKLDCLGGTENSHA